MKKNKRQTMKLNASAVLITLAALLISLASKAQTDSLQYLAETRHDSVVEYLTPMEYAFMFHEETSWLLKGTFSASPDLGRVAGSLKLSLEKNLVKGFSLNAVLFNAATYSTGNSLADISGIEFSLESRWYYKNQKKLQENKSTANLSGSYIALGTGYRKFFGVLDNEFSTSDLEFMPIFAKWGFQRRFLKRGFFDVGVMAGWNKSLSGVSGSSLFFNTYVDAGLAFTKDKYKLDFDKLCPVLRCHAEDRFLLKTNLVNIINLSYFNGALIGFIAPNIEAEFKLGKSPFSINTKLGSKFQYAKSLDSDFKENTNRIEPQMTIDGRYYYNLRRRMLTGKSGNGLSANYISLGVMYRGIYMKRNFDISNYRHDISFVGIKLGYGIQRLISNHLYLNINLGIAFGIQHSYRGGPVIKEQRGIIDFGFGIGYRF